MNDCQYLKELNIEGTDKERPRLIPVGYQCSFADCPNHKEKSLFKTTITPHKCIDEG